MFSPISSIMHHFGVGFNWLTLFFIISHIILLLCMPGHFLLDARHELYLVNIPINILELCFWKWLSNLKTV